MAANSARRGLQQEPSKLAEGLCLPSALGTEENVADFGFETLLGPYIDYRDLTDEIALLAALNEAEAEIQNGHLVSNEQMKERIENWSGKFR